MLVQLRDFLNTKLMKVNLFHMCAQESCLMELSMINLSVVKWFSYHNLTLIKPAHKP